MNTSFDGLSPSIWRNSASNRDNRAGSSLPRLEFVGVIKYPPPAPSGSLALIFPALPTEKPRANRLAACSTSSCRMSASFISLLQHRARLQEEVRCAEIARLQRHQ